MKGNFFWTMGSEETPKNTWCRRMKKKGDDRIFRERQRWKNVNGMLYEVKQFLLENFDMKDMGEASYVIGIKILRER